jgi:hypothetical protein
MQNGPHDFFQKLYNYTDISLRSLEPVVGIVHGMCYFASGKTVGVQSLKTRNTFSPSPLRLTVCVIHNTLINNIFFRCAGNFDEICCAY